TSPRSASASMSRRIVMSETPSTRTRSATRAPPLRRTRSRIDACLCCASTGPPLTTRCNAVPAQHSTEPNSFQQDRWVQPVTTTMRTMPERAGTGRADTFAPVVVRAADGLARWVTRMLGASATAGRESISEAELRDLVAANIVLSGEERHIIDEVLAAGARHVREVMVPRTDVVFLDASLPVANAVAAVRAARHSRFPVIDGSHDDVVGFVHLRDLLIRPEPDGAVTVGELAREVKRLPASKRVLPALSEMRNEGHHLAVVVDEYGGTAGIVTLEDLIEELVGEITDEYDLAPDSVPGEVPGGLNLSDF